MTWVNALITVPTRFWLEVWLVICGLHSIYFLVSSLGAWVHYVFSSEHLRFVKLLPMTRGRVDQHVVEQRKASFRSIPLLLCRCFEDFEMKIFQCLVSRWPKKKWRHLFWPCPSNRSFIRDKAWDRMCGSRSATRWMLLVLSPFELRLSSSDLSTLW